MSSRMNPQEYQVLKPAKFEEFCKVLAVKELCCLEPDKKVIERGFRKRALKCHPDKGGDPIEFKKINDAYNRLIGHIDKLEQQAEAIELANSILIEVSKTSVVKWQKKLKTRYGWFKSDNCKNLIFDGPYKQYMGRSKNTGNMTVVLYEDPPDGIPKLHVRTSKYMAWIAEQMMPVHMHVEKGRAIQFDQWRIAHLAEFGIFNFAAATTPGPMRKEPPKKETKTKRKAREESENSRPKSRRDSQPTPEPDLKMETDKENTEPKKQDKQMKKEEEKQKIIEKLHNCGHCGAGFDILLDYVSHKKACVPDEEFDLASEREKCDFKDNKTKGEEPAINKSEKTNADNGDSVGPDLKKETAINADELTDKKLKNGASVFQCDICQIKFSNMVWYTKHKSKNICVNKESKADTAPSKTEDQVYETKMDNSSEKEKITEPVEIVTTNGSISSRKETVSKEGESNVDILSEDIKSAINKDVKLLGCHESKKECGEDTKTFPSNESENCHERLANTESLTSHQKSQVCKDQNKKCFESERKETLPFKSEGFENISEDIHKLKKHSKTEEIMDPSIHISNEPMKSSESMRKAPVPSQKKKVSTNKATGPQPKISDLPMESLLQNLPTAAKPMPDERLENSSEEKSAKQKRASIVFVVGPNSFCTSSSPPFASSSSSSSTSLSVLKSPSSSCVRSSSCFKQTKKWPWKSQKTH